MRVSSAPYNHIECICAYAYNYSIKLCYSQVCHMMYEMALLKLSRFRPSRVVSQRLLSASLPQSEEESRDEATEARAKPFSEMPGRRIAV